MSKAGPIGIFDSGVGGLSIARSIKRLLPSENLLYVADLRFSPYGEKSEQLIQSRSDHIAAFLLKQKCKAIVVACNTATVNSISMLRENFDIPFIGVEPGIKPAALQSHSGVIGVLATEGTIKSASFQKLTRRFSNQVKIECQACPKLVELVECGKFSGEECIKIVSEYVLPLLSNGADHIVLGCTHYSFLTPVIEKVVEGRAVIVDTAEPVSLELDKRLTHLNLLNRDYGTGKVQFFSTEMSDGICEKVNHLLGCNVDSVEHVE